VKIKYSLIIPCWNEAQSLKILIPQLLNIVDTNNIEFVLINNGSTDDTSELFKKISNNHINVINLDNNAGYGGGIKAGLFVAKGEFIGWIHADLQYSIFEVVDELKRIAYDAEYIKGKRRGRTLFQNYISLNMSIFESVLFRKLIYDINAQPTLFHRDFITKFNDIPDDFSIDLYSYVLAKKFKLKIRRFNVNFMKRGYGHSTWNFGLSSLMKMIIRTIKYSFFLRKSI
jgi:glycosyltransferase involved in cell wall biosynthesis